MPSIPGGRRRWNPLRGTAVMFAVAVSLASAPAALADPGYGHSQDGGYDPQPIADSGDENFGLTDEASADLTMGDS